MLLEQVERRKHLGETSAVADTSKSEKNDSY